MSRHDKTSRASNRLRRNVVLIGLVVWLVGMLATPAAIAEPTSVPEPQLDRLPANLQKYVPNSAAWASSTWMAADSCKDKGGDFSVWTASVITDTADLQRFFGGYDLNAPLMNEKLEFEAELYNNLAAEVAPTVPPGRCVDDLTRWSGGPKPDVKPFGFEWGAIDGSGYYCSWRRDALHDNSADYANRWVGAERAACDGFRVNCDSALQEERPRCDEWNFFAADYIDRIKKLRTKINDWISSHHLARGQGKVDTQIGGKIPDIVGNIALGWFQDITKAIAQGAATLMAEAMTFWTQTDRSSMLQSPAIGEIQGLLRWVGLVVLIGSVMWQGIMMLYKRKPDPLVSTGMGLLSYAAWSTLGTTAAVLLYEGGNALATQVLEESISKFSTTMGTAMQANVAAAVAIIFFLGIVLFFLACIQWVLGFFRMGALVILLALIPTAAAGQVNDATKPWLRKVLSWSLSLILYQPIAAVIFAIGFVLIGDGTDISTILTGMAVLCLAVISMPTMLRFFDWGGQRFVSSGGGGGGGAMAVGAAASALGGGGAVGFSRFMDQSGPAGRGGANTDAGAPPVSSAHTGNGPGDRPNGGQPPSGGQPGGTPRAPGSNVAAAHAGAGNTANATTATAAGAGAASGATAVAGPAGAAIAGAQAAKDRVSGAMTEGSPNTAGGS